jgi:hypothetical protein
MADTNYEPYATKEDLQALRGDLLERIGRIEGQLVIILRLAFVIAGCLVALVGLAIKQVFFP